MKMHKCEQKTPEDPEFMFMCPACGCGHWFKTTGTRAKWTWNEDFDKPTVSPSILTWTQDTRCHSFVRDGKIQFLGDCTHDLAGKTVDLEDW